MTRLPVRVRHDDTDADRVMLAAWFRVTGDQDIADLMVKATLGDRADGVEAQIVELAELLADHELCFDDPQHYAWTREGRERPGAGNSWDDYAVQTCDALLVDAQRLAMRIAHPEKSQRLVVAR